MKERLVSYEVMQYGKGIFADKFANLHCKMQFFTYKLLVN